MQNITISGNLTGDARVLQDQNGKEYMSFRVAVNETRRGEKTSTCCGVTAVRAGVLDYLKKGQGVIVSGHLSSSCVEKDGKTFTNVDVFARDLELTGQPRGSSGGGGTPMCIDFGL